MSSKDVVAQAGVEDVALDIDDDDIEISADREKSRRFMDKFGKILPSIFGVCAAVILVLWVIGLAVSSEQSGLVWGIIIVSFICSVIGVWAIIQYGVIKDQIDRLKEQNKKYAAEINTLTETKDRLGAQVDELQGQVTDLQTSAENLEKQVGEFQDLIDELKGIAGNSEDINKLIDGTNKIFTDMKESLLENERATLLRHYYNYAFRDDDDKMNKQEYGRFLGNLSTEQRDKFEKEGTFEEIAGKDGAIDLNEFQDVLEKVLADLDEKLKQEFGQEQ